jgi:hypothetical protein
MTVQCFKWSHLNACLITIVVGEFCQREAFIPVLVILKYAGSKHVLQDLIYPFCLSVRLRMICGASD